jgi:hypothetical protein
VAYKGDTGDFVELLWGVRLHSRAFASSENYSSGGHLLTVFERADEVSEYKIFRFL